MTKRLALKDLLRKKVKLVAHLPRREAKAKAKLVAHLPKRALPLPARIHPIVTQMMTKRLALKDLLRKEAKAKLVALLLRKEAKAKLMAHLPRSPLAEIRRIVTLVTAMTMKVLLTRMEVKVNLMAHLPRKVAKANLMAHLPRRAPAEVHPIAIQMMMKKLALKDLLRKEATPMVLPSRKEATLKALLPKSPPAKVRPTATRVTIAMTVTAQPNLKRNEANLAQVTTATMETKCK